MIERRDGPDEHDRYLKKSLRDGRSFKELRREREIARQRTKEAKKDIVLPKKTMDVDYSPIEVLAQRYGLKNCFKHMSLGMSMRYHYDNGKIYSVTQTPTNRGKKFVIEKELVDLPYDELKDE